MAIDELAALLGDVGAVPRIRLDAGTVRLLRIFVDLVERRAEAKMLATGKLEGAHYAAMKELMSEFERDARP